jgi:hypothetical protein
MNKSLQILVTVVCIYGCSIIPYFQENSKSVEDNNWIYGMWLTVSATDTLADRHKQKRNTDIEKHIIYFMHSGELRRYSKNKGWSRLLVDFRVEGDNVMMHPYKEKKYFPLCKRIEKDKLEMIVPPNGRFTYVKLGNNIDMDDINLSGSPEIKNTIAR